MIPHEKKNNDLLVFWLSSILLLILIMIIVGGLTRLTNSGLSITNWELFKESYRLLTSSHGKHIFNRTKKFLNTSFCFLQ